MTHYRRQVATVYSPKFRRRFHFTLPTITAQNCDVHFVDTEKFANSRFYAHVVASRRHRQISLSSDPIRFQTLNALLERSDDFPAPMPYGKKAEKKSKDNIWLDDYTNDLLPYLILRGVKSFPFCIARGDYEPAEISAELSAFRAPEPAEAWESHFDSNVMLKNGFPYLMSDSHMLEDVRCHFDTVLASYSRVTQELEALEARLAKFHCPADYDDIYAEAMHIREKGGDPTFESGLRWNRPDIVSYRDLQRHVNDLKDQLADQKKMETARTLIDLSYGAGEFGLHVSEPDRSDNFLKALITIRPYIEMEIAAPQGKPLELLRRFFALHSLIEKRREEIWAGMVDNEGLVILETVMKPLAQAIERNPEAANLAKRALKPVTFAYLEEVVNNQPASSISRLPFLPMQPATKGPDAAPI